MDGASASPLTHQPHPPCVRPHSAYAYGAEHMMGGADAWVVRLMLRPLETALAHPVLVLAKTAKGIELTEIELFVTFLPCHATEA